VNGHSSDDIDELVDDGLAPTEDATLIVPMPDDEAADRSWWRRHGLDVAIAVGLFAVSFVFRRDSGPTSGFWYDDSWVASGSRTGPGDLWTVATSHPGFSFMLMVWREVVTERSSRSAVPMYLAGSLAAPALYALLRSAKVHLAPATFVAMLLAMSATHTGYSGRLKPYVIEVVVIIALAAIVPRLASQRWRWAMGAAWAVSAILIATVSAFCAVAVAVAGLVLVANATSDRLVRVAAVGVQGALQVALVLSVRRTYNTAQFAKDWEDAYDGYIELDRNPIDIVRQLALHLTRIGDAYTGGARIDSAPPEDPGLLTIVANASVVLVAVAAIAALAFAAIKGSRRPMAQFLLGLVVVAFVGGLARQIPFGPKSTGQLFSGYRATLWLLPSLAVGLALALDALLHAAQRRSRPLALGLCALALVAAVAMVPLKHKDSGPYGDIGTSQATRFILDRKAADDAVLVIGGTENTYAAEPGVSFSIEPTPERIVGFRLAFPDGTHIVKSGQPVTPRAIAPLVQDARRVYIYNGFTGFVPGTEKGLEQSLPFFGFTPAGTHDFGVASVNVWQRDQG
jgi:hypothetical protein